MLCCHTSAECFVVRTINKNTQTQIAQSLGANTGGGGWGQGGGQRTSTPHSRLRMCGPLFILSIFIF